jgi:serine/threonine protein phosphatase PrpC
VRLAAFSKPVAGVPRPAAVGALRVEVAHSTRAGRRGRNEDFAGATTPEGPELAAKGALLAIADGVGGHANGREAAEFSVRNLLVDYYATPDTWGAAQALDTVLQAANRWLLAHARKAPENGGMATTLTALVLRGARYYVAHVGDTRAYLARNGRLTQLTEDHTWEHPELSNVLRRAIGLCGRATASSSPATASGQRSAIAGSARRSRVIAAPRPRRRRSSKRPMRTAPRTTAPHSWPT